MENNLSRAGRLYVMFEERRRNERISFVFSSVLLVRIWKLHHVLKMFITLQTF